MLVEGGIETSPKSFETATLLQPGSKISDCTFVILLVLK